MKKQVTICFRTSGELRSALEKVAHDNGRSLSSVIELILTDYVLLATKEKQHFLRKAVGRPVEQIGALGLAALARRYPVEYILVAFALSLKNTRNLGEILEDLIGSRAVAEERKALGTESLQQSNVKKTKGESGKHEDEDLRLLW